MFGALGHKWANGFLSAPGKYYFSDFVNSVTYPGQKEKTSISPRSPPVCVICFGRFLEPFSRGLLSSLLSPSGAQPRCPPPQSLSW